MILAMLLCSAAAYPNCYVAGQWYAAFAEPLLSNPTSCSSSTQVMLLIKHHETLDPQPHCIVSFMPCLGCQIITKPLGSGVASLSMAWTLRYWGRRRTVIAG